MNTFTPPGLGAKLGEYKPEWHKRIYYWWISEIFGPILKFYWRWVFWVSAPIVTGFLLLFNLNNTEWLWASLTGGILLILFGGWMIYLQISALSEKNNIRATKKIGGKSLSLYLVKNGVEINDDFIPFANNNMFSPEFNPSGIVLFKLDGAFLSLKTESNQTPYLRFRDMISENEMKFKIEPNYLDHKNELLSHLNSLVEST